MAKPAESVDGTLDLFMLGTISLERKHGGAIAKRILALRRLEQQTSMKAEWVRVSMAINAVVHEA